MSFELDVQERVNVKMAGISDQLRSAFNYVTGANGSLSAGAYGLGGAGLGAAAMSGLGTPGMLAGGLVGGMMGYGGANAINQQGNMQNAMDTAMIGGMGAGLGANDQTDMMQTQAIQQQGQMLNEIVGYLNGGMSMGQTGGQMEDSSMMGAGQSSSNNGIGGAPVAGNSANVKKSSVKKASVTDKMIDEIIGSCA